MTQEEKDLLLKDLCARIPHGVKVNAPFTSNEKENAKGYKITGINFGVVEWTPVLFGEKKRRDSIIIEAFSERYNQYCSIDLELDDNFERVKPYLFPLSSMTKEQEREFIGTCVLLQHCTFGWTEKSFDWLNRNHFDFRGLIPLGLANNATGLNIY